jgi:hypothetical protein
VLYESNTVHIASYALMRYLPMLLLPQRLASIKSLELIWDLILFCPIQSTHYDQLVGWPVFIAFIKIVLADFPYLKKLYISIQTGTHMSDHLQSLERAERKLFTPLDEMLKLIAGQLESFEVAVPISHYAALVEKAEENGCVIESGGKGDLSWGRYWRSVTLEQEGQPPRNIGYWVRKGVDDAHLEETALN